jgi:hypothetical protein
VVDGGEQSLIVEATAVDHGTLSRSKKPSKGRYCQAGLSLDEAAENDLLGLPEVIIQIEASTPQRPIA